MLTFASCAHREPGEPHAMNRIGRAACVATNGDVYRDPYGDERCMHHYQPTMTYTTIGRTTTCE